MSVDDPGPSLEPTTAPIPPATGVARWAAWLVHLVVAIATTWPLAITGDRLPLGAEPTPTVPRFNLWTLRWTAGRLPHGLTGWWDAPIFAPHRGTFAWSEPQPLTGVAFAALQPLAGPVRAYGLLLVVTLALNGVAGAALARRLGASRIGATLGGVLVQTVPFAFDQLGVLQLLALWPVLALAASVLAWTQEGRRRHAVAAGLAFATGALTCTYLTLLAAIAFAPAALVLVLFRSHLRPGVARRWSDLALAGAIGSVLVAPVLIGQRRDLEGHRWLRSTIDAGSATSSDWVGGGRAAPTVALVVLGIAGAWIGRRRPEARLVAAAGVAAALVSFGTHLAIGPLRPWAILVDHVGPIAQLRSPYRATALTQVALAVLGALALGRLSRWTPGSRSTPRPDHHLTRRLGTALAIVVTLVAVALAGPGPGRFAVASHEPGAWHDRLVALDRAQQDRSAAVVFLPFAPSTATADFAATTERMLQNQDTGVAMANGYSGFFPEDHAALRADLRGFPDHRSLVALRDRGVRWAVVDPRTWDRFDAQVAATLGIRIDVADDDGIVLVLPSQVPDPG